MLPGLDPLVLPLAVLLSSLGAYVLARRAFRLRPGHLRAAVGTMLECVGLTVIFFVVNTAAGAVIVFAMRLLPIRFIALYATTDMVLLLLSLVQALIFYGWRATAVAPDPSAEPVR